MIEKIEAQPLIRQVGQAETFKVNVYWGAWSPQITNRILRDMFSLARLAKANRAQLIVATAPDLRKYLVQLGITCSENFEKPDMARLYVEENRNISDKVYAQLPEDLDYEVVALLADPSEPQTGPYIDKAPYANMPLKKTWQWIPPTMPLDKTPPRGTPEPMYSPFF